MSGSPPDAVPVFERLGVRVVDAVSLPGNEAVHPARPDLLLRSGVHPSTTLRGLEE